MSTVDNIGEFGPGLASGPAMMALTPLQRRFVLAMAADPSGSAKEWAVAAGYSNGADGAKVTAHRLLHEQPKIEAAIHEVARSLMFREAPLLAVGELLRIARNRKHPKQLRALETLANRVGLHELSEHRVRVEHTEESAELKAERIRMVAGLLGVDVAQLLGANNVSRETKAEPKLIEGKVVDGDGT